MCSPLKDGVIIFYEYKMSTLLIYLITLFFFLYNNENTYHFQLKNNSSYVIKHDSNFTQSTFLSFRFSFQVKELIFILSTNIRQKTIFLSSLYLFILSQMKLLSFSPKWSLSAGVLYIGNTIPNLDMAKRVRIFWLDSTRKIPNLNLIFLTQSKNGLTRDSTWPDPNLSRTNFFKTLFFFW